MGASETAFSHKVEELIRKRGGWSIKIHADAMQGVGYPDRLVGYRGFFIAFEEKAPSGKTDKIQKATLEKIIAAGNIAVSVRTIAEVEAVLNTIDMGVARG